MSRLDQLKKQKVNNESSKSSDKANYPDVLETIMNRPGESKLNQSEKEILDIDVSLIDVDDINEQLFGYEDLNKIETSFDTIGNNSIIYVYRRKGGRFLCFAGNQRLLATKKRGEKTITCMVAGDEPTEEKRIENLIFMNSQRTLRPYYIAKQLKAYESILRKNGKTNVKELIENKFGYKKAQQANYKSLLDEPEDVQSLFKRDDIPFNKLLETVKKLPAEKKNEYVMVFNSLSETEEVNTEFVIKVKNIVTKNESSTEGNNKTEKPIKTSQVFKDLIAIPYSADDEIVVPDDKKALIKEQATKMKEYLDKVLAACD